jgi:hypothetical protein
MINQQCSLVLHDLYFYDIKSAYPTILSKQFFDFQDTNLENKEQRNIFIGNQQRDNENLSSFLMTSVENLITYYLKENDIADEDVIVTQRDGFILKKTLEREGDFIKIDLRDVIDSLIIAIDRKKFLYSSMGKVTVKGVPHLYDKLDSVYQKFSNLNFYNKSNLFEQLENIKMSVLDCNDMDFFLMPIEDKFGVMTYQGDLIIKDPGLISIEKINKKKYFDHYFKDFLMSIYMETYK